MDDDIRRRLRDAAGGLEGDAGAPDALRRARHTWTQRRARSAVATFAIVAVAAAGMLRLAADGPATGSLVDPAAGDATPTVQAADEPSSTDAGPNATPRITRAPEPADHPTPEPEPTSSARSTEEPPRTAPGCPRLTRPGSPPEDVDVTVELAKRNYLPGEPVTITITVRNHGTTPITFDRGAQEFELVVISGADGRHEWVYSHDLVFTQEIRRDVLQPGESRTRTAVWNQSTCAGARVLPGGYSVMGWWKAFTDGGTGGGWMAGQVPRFTIGT